jgi:hypothetical protein
MGWVSAGAVSLDVHRRHDVFARMVAINSASRRPLFPLGKIVGTPGALDALAKSGDSAHSFFMRHACGDFGTVCQADWKANEDAIANGERVFSAYVTSANEKLWCITEADRSSTCLLLPDEY